jgi:hypothetical protein
VQGDSPCCPGVLVDKLTCPSSSFLLDQFDEGGGHFRARGSSVIKNHVAMNRPNNTQRVAARSMDISTWLTNTLQARLSGHVLIRMNTEGSEFAILRDLVDDCILCRQVNKLVIELYEWVLEAT